MKKVFPAVLLCACLLWGCGRTEPAPVQQTKPSRITVPAAAPTDPLPPALTKEDQIRCIAENAALWHINTEYGEPKFFTVADLDGNGRMEVIGSVCAGTGLFSTSEFWEVSEDGGALVPLRYGAAEGDSEPDLICDFVGGYEKDGKTWYIFTDEIRNGAAEHFSIVYALCKDGDAVDLEKLCASRIYYVDSSPNTEYYNGAGEICTAEEYFGAEERFFSGCDRIGKNFAWFQLPEGSDLELFAEEAYWTFTEYDAEAYG